jgi:hypothetical protein
LGERGRSLAANVIDHVMCKQPPDRPVRGDAALQFRVADNLPEILITIPDREQLFRMLSRRIDSLNLFRDWHPHREGRPPGRPPPYR